MKTTSYQTIKQFSTLDGQIDNIVLNPLKNVSTKSEKLDWGVFALLEFIISEQQNINKKFNNCLDIGSGDGQHSRILSSAGLDVYQLDKYSDTSQYKDDFLNIKFHQKFDVVFCSHVIEHQRNIGLFLDKIFDILSDKGVLIISAPKHPAERFVQGHLNCFIFTYFLQHLIHAGFDCKNGKFLSIGEYENSFILSKSNNFLLSERSEQGYVWTDKHHDRSFVNLNTGSTIENDQAYLYNCDVIKFSKDIKCPIKLEFPDNYKALNISLEVDKLGIGFKI